MNAKENDILMCTVSKIEGTTVFVTVEDNPISGSIVFSEIAAGRIRNIREYVNPGKKIVCKVLKIYPDHIELSLRRVTAKERDEINERYKKQKTFEGMLKAITKDPQPIINKIKEKYEIYAFFDEVKENPRLLEKFLDKKEAETVITLLQEKRDKEKEVKKTIIIKSYSDSGIEEIKDILKVDNPKVKIFYLGSSQFSISATAIDYKEAENLVNSTIESMQSKSKAKKAVFEIR